jgi:hypothetical protein
MTYERYKTLIYSWMALGLIVFLVLLKITAPYGRHASAKWGPQISNRLGWILMETPVMVLLLYYVIANASKQTAVTWTLVAFFLFHYVHRTYIFPLRIRTKGKKMPLVVVGSGVTFNLANGFFLGYYFGHFADYPPDYFVDPKFVIGSLLFFAGFYINWTYDNKLIHLRKPGDTSYVIPRGGLFKLISCPNLFGEIIEWTGYAVMCWNLPALSFLIWTIANLVPRAISHHKWYRNRFGEYPADRKAVVPYFV